MFQTSGYFKGLPCPYFENGLCERPYCHFGHFKSKPAPPHTGIGYEGNVSVAISGNNISGDFTKPPKVGEVQDVGSKPEVSSTFQKLDKVKWYNPTPIPKLLSHAEKEKKRRKQVKPAVPEYKPTPIHLLKKSAVKNVCDRPNISQDEEYIPTPIVHRNITSEQHYTMEKHVLRDNNKDEIPAEKDTAKNADVKSENVCNTTVSAEFKLINESQVVYTEKDTAIAIQGSENLHPKSKDSNVTSEISNSMETTDNDNSITIEDIEKCRVEVLLIENESTNVKKEPQVPVADVVIVDESSSQDEIKPDVQSISSGSEKSCKIVSEKEITSDSDKKNTKVTENIEEHTDDLQITETGINTVTATNAETSNVSVTHHCSCSKNAEASLIKDKKHGKSKKHKKHKKHSSSRKHKSSKSSHKHKSHKNKRKKHKHKSSSKKSKYHSSSDSESSSSSSSSDEEEFIETKTSPSKKSYHRSSRKRSTEDKQLKKKKHRSLSSSRSSSTGRKKHSSHSKELTSKSEKSHKRSKASKRRHSSSSSSSSDSESRQRRSVKRKKSTDLESVKSDKKSKVPSLNKNMAEASDQTTSVTNKNNNEPKELMKAKSSEKRHINIFDALNEKSAKDKCESSGEKTEKSKVETENHSNLVEDSHSLLSNHLPPTPTASKPSRKPVFQKSMSHVALFGEDSDQEMPVEPVKNNGRNESDSDSVVLSSDSDLVPLNTTLKQEPGKLILPSMDLEDVDFSDNDPFDECLQIFNEVTPAVQKNTTIVKPVKDEEDKVVTLAKKREAHGELKMKSSTVQRVEAERKTPRPSASQVMHSRLLAAQEQSLAEQEEFLQKKKPKVSQDPFGKKQRVAHVLPTKKETGKMQKKSTNGAKRDGKEKKKAKRPIIPPDFGSKVATCVRQQYLNKMIDDCLKIYTEDQDAYDRAVMEEKIVYDRSNNKNVYVRVAVNAIKKLRDEISSKSQESSKKVVSHMSVLGGAKAAHTHFTLNRSGTKAPLALTVGVFCEYLEETHLMTEAQLEENGYPRTDLEKPGHARFSVRDKAKCIVTSDKFERQCVRCGKRFHVAPQGTYVRTEECFYHWGKAWKRKIAGVWDNKWTCCGGDLSAKGCQVCKAHVHEYNKYTTTSGFVKTLPCSPKPEDECRVYSVDCEMVYTLEGLELGRVTVVDFNSETILEKLVKPGSEVIDYNTRFSGLTAADMKGVRTSLRDIQAILLSLFTQKTILLGHSLESDLMALKLIHSNVVDTSIVFPHKLGLPYKRALKTLMGEYLQKIIQEDEGGHDSMEDASACMELMIWKAKNDLKYTKLKRL